MGAHNQLMSVRRCRYACEKKGGDSGLHKRKECAGVSFRAHIQSRKGTLRCACGMETGHGEAATAAPGCELHSSNNVLVCWITHPRNCTTSDSTTASCSAGETMASSSVFVTNTCRIAQQGTTSQRWRTWYP